MIFFLHWYSENTHSVDCNTDSCIASFLCWKRVKNCRRRRRSCDSHKKKAPLSGRMGETGDKSGTREWVTRRWSVPRRVKSRKVVGLKERKITVEMNIGRRGKTKMFAAADAVIRSGRWFMDRTRRRAPFVVRQRRTRTSPESLDLISSPLNSPEPQRDGVRLDTGRGKGRGHVSIETHGWICSVRHIHTVEDSTKAEETSASVLLYTSIGRPPISSAFPG